jgi:hypothetical protein
VLSAGASHSSRTKAEELFNKDPEIQALMIHVNTATATINQLRLYLAESSHNWWTIAIPEDLHKAGGTYQESTAKQIAAGGHSFFNNIVIYLNLLRDRPQDFGLSAAIFLEALGAFRHLYRSQVKHHSPAANLSKIGVMPYYFFHSRESRAGLDALFTGEAQAYLSARV